MAAHMLQRETVYPERPATYIFTHVFLHTFMSRVLGTQAARGKTEERMNRDVCRREMFDKRRSGSDVLIGFRHLTIRTKG